MPIDIALLASTVVAKYLLPYVAMAAKGVAQKVSEKVEQVAAEQFKGFAKKLWDRVSAAFSKPKEQGALELFKDDPEGLKGTVEKILREKLESDPKLAQELSELIPPSESQAASTGAQISDAFHAAIVDLRQANFQNAQNARIIGMNVGSSSSQPTSGPKDDSSTKPGETLGS